MSRICAFLVPGLLLGSFLPTLACTVMPPTKNLQERKAASPMTLHGVMVGSEIGKVCNADARLLSFRVIKAFGGDAKPGDTVVVSTPTSSAACGVDYPVGMEVIVFTGTSWGCPSNSNALGTSMASHNVDRPTQAHLDSLNQTTALRPALGSSVARNPRAVGPVRSGARVTYALEGGDLGSADGRLLPD